MGPARYSTAKSEQRVLNKSRRIRQNSTLSIRNFNWQDEYVDETCIDMNSTKASKFSTHQMKNIKLFTNSLSWNPALLKETTAKVSETMKKAKLKSKKKSERQQGIAKETLLWIFGKISCKNHQNLRRNVPAYNIGTYTIFLCPHLILKWLIFSRKNGLVFLIVWFWNYICLLLIILFYVFFM